MATDTTGVSTETASTQALEHDVERVVLTQGVTQVQVPDGTELVRVQVTPGETIQLPFPNDRMMARLDDGNGNLAIKVGDVTVILQGYIAATGEADVILIDNAGQAVDVAAVVAATDPNLDIATAAGPGAGDQGTGPDNNGGLFAPFDPAAGIGGLNAIGGLGATQLQYGLIEREFDVIEEDAEETDTSPVLVSLTPGDPVNEDDLERQESSLAKALDPFPNHIQDGLSDVLGGNTPSYWGHPQEQGNDPFDTNDHEYPSQNGYSDNYWGVDQDREPLTSTAIASVNFFGDVPGHLSFGTGTQPIVDQLTAMGLTSHSHELQYVVLPGVADDPNTAEDESHGETLVAYYVETYGEGEQTYSYATIVFTIAMREFEGTDPISDFNIDFTIYGVIDNVPGIADADGNILDALDIDVPFFMVDSGGSSVQVPTGTLVFKDIDDVPSFGSLTYDWVELGEESGAWLPVDKNPSDTDIEHDETPGVQGQEEQNAATYSWYVDQALAAAGLAGETPLGAALTQITVSFGADGRAGTYDEGGYTGNKEAGKTVFAGDGDANATAFQLYMGTSAVPLSEGQTNWTTNINGEPQVILARQIDAQTIVGYVPGVAEGENPVEDIPVFVLRIDPATGEVVLVQLAQINHGDASDSNDLVDNLLITPLGGGGTVDVLTENFDSLANWSSTGGDFVRIVGDVGTADPQPNPANQALLTSGGEEGDSASAQDIADFFGLDIGALDVVNDGNPANGDENATNGSAIKREIEVEAGDTMTVRFNFLENEEDGSGSGASWQDMAFIVIGGEVIRLANVGDFGTANSGSDNGFSWSEESGYLTFTYTFTTTGPIQIGFGVMNEGDESVDAGLLVDQLTVTRGDHGVTARATDYDGDFVETPLTVVIRDDGPTIKGKLDWMVDEDGKDGGTPLAGGLPGGPGDGNGGTWVGFSGQSLGIDFGTDGPAADAITFDPAKIVLRDTTGAIVSPLKSHGVDVVFTWNAALSQLVGKAGDTEIMVLSVDQANGTVSFELKGPVDHPYSDDPYAPGTDLAFEDEFQIDFGFTAKDADGDTVEHTMIVRVDDDSPTLEAVSEASVNVTLDESVGADASDPQTAPNADEPAETGAIGTVTGSVTGLFQNIQFGADGPGAATAYKLILKDVGGAGTSIGTTEVPTNLQVNDPNGLYPVDNIVLVSVSAYQINAYVGSYDGESDNNVLAFLVRVDKATGELTVSQFLPLSHGTDGSDALSHDDILTLAVPRGGGIYVSATVADFDGDKATVEAPAPLGISFEDDGPKATGWEFETNTRDKDFDPETKDDVYAIIDEDELPGGGQNFYSGDDDGGTKASGFVLADFGSDGAAAENGGFALNLDAGILAALKTSAGLDLHIDLANSDAGQLIVRDSNDALVFTLTLHPDAQDPSKGAWDFELHQALKHNQADTEDNIYINFGVTLTDGDGDTATSAIRIMVDDDMPAPEPDVGGSYVELTKNDLGTVEDFLLANDLPGADGLKSIEILYSGDSVPAKGGKLEISGGHVWYTAPNVQDDTNEVFWYRLTDNDGDTRDTSVTVTVTDRGGGDGSVSLKITGVGGYEDGENSMQGQTNVDPINQQLSLPFNLKITVIDAGDTADSITIGGVPTGAVLKYGLVDLPAADGSGNITITRGGAFDALLDALTTPGGADVDVVLQEHDSRDFTLTLNGVVDQVAISQGSKEAIVDAVAAQPAFSIEPLDQSKVEAGELASGTVFTVNTQVAFADFGDGNETQYIFIKTPTEPGWSLGEVSVNGNVLTPVVNPLAGNPGWPSLASGFTVYAVSSQADSGSGTVPVTIVVNGPADPTDTVTKTLEVKAVAIDIEEGSLATDPLNNVAVAEQAIDLTVTDRTGGTDEVSFVGGGLGGYEDNEATTQGQSNVDEPSDQKLSLTFNLKATATDLGDAVDSVEVGGIPSGATATWTGPGGLSLTFAPGLTTITPTSGGTGTDASRAAFLADLIDGNGANITLTLAEHDSRDVTLTMKSVIDGTATAGANASAIVDAVAAQPVFTAPAPGAQSKVETGLPASFLITTSVNFADVADANEKQYVLVKLPAAGWTLNFVTPTGNFDSTAVVALPGYPGYYVLEVQPTETGALPLTISISGPSDVTGTVNEEIEMRALTVDAVEGLDLDPDNNTAEAVQKVTLAVTDSAPTVNAQAAIAVDEDGLPGANAGVNDDGKGDDPADDSASQTGNFSITSPVDTITAIKLETTGGLTGLETLDGKAVRTVWDSGTATLVGFADLNNDGIKDAGERTVFTLAVTNPATGAYKLDLLEALKHSASNGGLGSNYEDDLGFTVNITVTDDDGSTGTGTVSIVIDDDTPTANNDGAFEVAEDTPLPISVFGNDKFGADGVDTTNAANITFTQGAKGSVAYDAATGLFTYSPNAGAEGADSFTYTIKDKDGDTSTATVTLNIAKDSEPRIATPSNMTVDEDGLGTGNKDDTTPRNDETAGSNSTNATGSVVVNFGNDVPAGLLLDSIVLLDTAALDGQLLTLGGGAVTFALEGGALYGRAPDNSLVITISVSSAIAGPNSGEVTYHYQTNLLQPVKHVAGGIENTVTLSGITFEVTDKDGDKAQGNFSVSVLDDVPSLTASATQPDLIVDESSLGDNATANFAGVFTSAFGADGMGADKTYALGVSAPGAVSGLVDTASGLGVYLFLVGGQVVGKAGVDAAAALIGSTVVFTVSVDASGNVILDQQRAVMHDNDGGPGAAHDDPKTLLADDLVTLTATITDGDGDTHSAVANIGTNLVFEDDGPSLSAGGIIPTLTVDESNFAIDQTLNFAGIFSPTYGADGAGSVGGYALGINAGVTGLVDTLSGQPVVLSMNGLVVEGKTNPGGDLVFTVSVDASGNVTLNQLRAVVHPTTDPDEPKTLSAANLITLTATVTDKDGDTNTATANIAQNLVFKDDGPAAGDKNFGSFQEGAAETNLSSIASFVAAHVAGGNDQYQSGSFTLMDGATPVTTLVGSLGGTLTLSGGNILYTPPASVDQDGATSETFTYRIADQDGDLDTGLITVSITDGSGPVLAVASGTVDEEGLTGGLAGTAYVDNSDAAGESKSTGGTLGVTLGSDPLATDNAFNFTGVNGLGGLQTLDNTLVVLSGPVASGDAANTILTYTGYKNGGNPLIPGDQVFVLTLNQDTGQWSFELKQPVKHPNANTEDDLALAFGVSVTDIDGTVGTTIISVSIDDDSPTLSASGIIPTLTVDESAFAVDQTLGFAGVFVPNYGADGAGTVGNFVLGINAGATGLVDTGTNLAVNLFLIGGQVVGSTATLVGDVLPGNTVFTVSVDGAGNVTLDQQRAVMHPTANPDEPKTLSAANLITLTATVTDKDGDTNTATANIAQNLVFKDDGPSLVASASQPTITVDETILNSGASKDFAGVFTPTYGADGAGGVGNFVLGIKAPNADSGLVDTASGEAVVLTLVGSSIVGVTQTGLIPVFTISVDAGGNVTLTQHRAVIHPTTDPDEPKQLAADDLITLTATVTDKDGDSNTATAQIGLNFTFEDDGPIANNDPTLSIITLNAAVAGTNLLDNDNAGADGGKTVVGIRLGGEVGIYAPVDLGGTDIQIKADGTEGTPAIGTLHVNPDGSWTFTQTEGSELPNLTFSYQMKDKDGDVDTASFQVNLDSVPTITVTNDGPQAEGGYALVDEDWISGGAKDVPVSAGDNAGGASASGTWSTSNGDPTVTVTVAGIVDGSTPTGATTFDGTPILWFMAGNTLPTTLTGKTDAAGAAYFTLTVNDNGTWTFTLLQPMKHEGADSEDPNVLLNAVTLQAVDNDGDTATAAIRIAIDDDMPVAGNDLLLATLDDNAAGVTIGTVAGLLANDTYGADGKAVSGDIVIGGGSLGGSVSIIAGNLVYTSGKNVTPGTEETETFTYTIKDADGDTATATFQVKLTDTKATFSVAPANSAVDEEGLGGNAGDSYADGKDLTGEAVSVSGQALNINYGTDTPGTVTFDAAQAGLAGVQTSDGTPVNFTLLSGGTVLVGYTGGVAPTGTGDAQVVYYASLNAAGSGSYDFTLVKALKHPTANTEDDLALTFSITAKDSEGEGSSATFTVTVDDDAPTAANDGKLADLDDNAAGVTIGTVAGILTNDFYGADGKAASGDFVIGAGDKGGSVIISGGNLVYTSATNVTPGATVTETFTYTIKDKDGDTKSATFSVNLTDTKATFSVAPANSAVDEEGLGGNAGDSYVTGDLAGQAVSVTNQALNINYGTDTPGSVSFDVAQAGLAGLQTSNGTPVNFTIIGGTLLLGYTGGVAPTGTSDAQVVFHASLNGAGTGTYDFTLKQALRHPTANTEDDLALTFSITAKDSEGEGSSATFTVTVDDDAPLANADTRTMDEQSSITGNVYGVTGAGAGDVADAIGADGPNAAGAVISGKSVNLAGATKNVDADGEVITGQYGNLTLKSDGTYSYQAGSISGGNKQDVFEYTIKDSDGDTKTTTLTINVNDQINFIPDAVDDINDTASVPLNYQLMLVLDMSGSMDEDVGGQTRLAVARDSLINLLNQYKNSTSGTVEVKLVVFAEDSPINAEYRAGSNGAFATVDAAIAALQAIGDNDGNGNTDYDDAIHLAMQGINNPSWQTSVTGVLESKVYFISDGRPTDSDSPSPFGAGGDDTNAVNDFEEGVWQAALQAKGVQSIAVGVGADIVGDSSAQAQLGQVAYTPGGAADGPVLNVTDESQLSAVLGSTAPAPINGFLFANDVVNPADPLVTPQIWNLTLVDDADTDFVSQTFDASTWTIVTNNGTLVVDRTDGSYDYTPKAGSEGKSDSFVYTIKDTNGGDQDSATLTINIKAAPVITSDGGGNTATINVVEGTKAVTDVNATDADTAQSGLTYSITGGADAALFDIDSVTGQLSFKNAPDYENPTDAGADNKYNVTVKVTDGSLSDTQAITVTVTDKNDVAPTLAIGNIGTTYTVRDNFDSVTFNGNNGTKNWLGNWTESGDDNTAAGGDVKIASDGGNNALFLYDTNNTDSSIQRSVDLSGAGQATLEFDYRSDTSSNDETVRVQVSTDGINWTTLLTITNDVTQPSTHFTADISAYISANTRIRFIADSGLEDNDYSWFDNVQISYGLAATNYATTFTEGGSPVSIAALTSAVTDSDSTNMASAVVKLTNAFAGDALAVGGSNATNGTIGGINWTKTTVGSVITVTFTGSATKAAYESAIEAVTFSNSSSTPNTTPRNVEVTVNDGFANSNTAISTITVVDVNLAPETNATAASGAEDAAAIAIVLSGSDADGNVAAFRIKSLPVNGDLYLDAGATQPIADEDIVAAIGNSVTIYYKPDANFDGSNTFQYAAIDNLGVEDASAATASITVTPDVPPVAYDNFKQAVVSQIIVPPSTVTTTLADFQDTTNDANSGAGYNPWIFDTAGTGDSTTEGANVQTAAADKWGRTSSSDVFVTGSNALQIFDSNGNSAGSGAVSTPSFVVDAGKTGALSFVVSNEDINGSDVGACQLYLLSGGSFVPTVFSAAITSNGTVTINNIPAGTYRLVIQVTDGASGDARIDIDNISLAITTPGSTTTNTTNATGNVRIDAMNLLTSSDPWGATDTNGTEATTLQAFISGVWTTIAGGAGTVIDTPHGTLTISQDGAYTFVPDADIGNVGEQDVVQYRLLQADGDFDTANLVLGIGGAAYVEPTATNVTGNSTGSGNADILLGNDNDNNMNGGNSDDRLEGRGGDDTLTGGAGVDYLLGGAGDDTLIFDAQDKFDGGSGFDRVQSTESTFTFNSANGTFANIEMVDLGDTGNHNRTVVINAADVLDTPGISVGGHDVDLFVIGSGTSGNSGNRDNVDLNGFTQVATGVAYTDDVTGISHTYNIYQGTGGNSAIKVAVEAGLDMI